MTDTATPSTDDAAVWNLAERFIELANQQLDHQDLDHINLALMVAATQFNAFTINESIAQVDDAFWEDEKDTALRRFTKQYRLLLEDGVNQQLTDQQDDA